MSKSLAAVRKTTTRDELLCIMMDSYLFPSKKAARNALGSVCVALRAWMIAMTANPPKSVMTRLTVPGVGAIRIGWYSYEDRDAAKVRMRFEPTKKVRDQLRRANKAEYENWKKGRTP